MKGGKLCDNGGPNDIYTLGEHAYPGIYADKTNPDVLIKIIRQKGEFDLAKYLEVHDFVPKVLGFFDCTNNHQVVKYSFQQQRIKAHNWANPDNVKDLGSLSYETKEQKVLYMVMERIDGKSLAEVDNLSQYIDEIYRLYNILADKGITLDDLAARNILLSKKGKIYFIDFEPVYTTITHSAIPLSKRVSKETLLKMLPLGPAMYREESKMMSRRKTKSGGKTKKRRRRRRHL